MGCLCCMQTACFLLCRGVPQPASLPAEPIALLDDMDTGMPFSSAPAAVQQQKTQDSKLEGSGKKPKKEKHKKESKEKKHKKHKKEKKSKAGVPTFLSLLMQ